ncbi:MAG TPA: hypothetical protein PLE60_15445, partial [Candidatus Latescibacteria bacterium]|nr:hypothetical protein [Candidatus Latescibacterota bacterium]
MPAARRLDSVIPAKAGIQKNASRQEPRQVGVTRMPVRFDNARWERVRCLYRDWWAGKMDRPL